jgi:hypothetical protein
MGYDVYGETRLAVDETKIRLLLVLAAKRRTKEPIGCICRANTRGPN